MVTQTFSRYLQGYFKGHPPTSSLHLIMRCVPQSILTTTVALCCKKPEVEDTLLKRSDFADQITDAEKVQHSLEEAA